MLQETGLPSPLLNVPSLPPPLERIEAVGGLRRR
jgi:hypothetical protein